MRDLEQNGPPPSGEQHSLAMYSPGDSGARDTIGDVDRVNVGHALIMPRPGNFQCPLVVV
jgi:hypothetical protein